ncbi:hypothetical protein D3C87_1206290 [compost metagenome]
MLAGETGRGEADAHGVAQQVGHHGRLAALRHMDHARIELAIERLPCQVAQAAGPPRAVAQLLAWLCCQLPEVVHVLHTQFQVGGKDRGTAHDLREKDEVALRIVGQALVERDIVDQRVAQRDGDGVAIRRGTGDLPQAHGAIGTRLVVDHDRLAQGLGHALADEPRHEVIRATGLRGDDDADGLARERALGEACKGQRGEDGGQAQCQEGAAHRGLLLLCV